MVGEDKSVREKRLTKFLAEFEASSDSEDFKNSCSPPIAPKTTKTREFLNSSWSDVNRGSPRSNRRSWKERKVVEGNFFEMLRDPDTASVRSAHQRGSSFRRRRSLDSRPRSKEISRDQNTANGGVINKREFLKDPHRSGLKDSDSGRLPAINIIDEGRQNEDTYVYLASETDKLLESNQDKLSKGKSPNEVIMEVEGEPRLQEGLWQTQGEEIYVPVSSSSNPQLSTVLSESVM